jgi:CRP/FNR family transcriptional regulator, cyclic AMP receptor protein
MAHWMCTECGYYLQGMAPPDKCPGCQQACLFNNVTCYRPECGGEKNIDPLVVANTLMAIKAGPQAQAKLEPTLPSGKSAPEIDILSGLGREQRQLVRDLGRIEYYESSVAICLEGSEARKLYLIEEGHVAVESKIGRDLHFPTSIIHTGEVFGWSALVEPYVYTASVRTLSKTRVIAIEQKALMSLMQGDPSLGFIITQNLAKIVASRLRRVELALVGTFKAIS